MKQAIAVELAAGMSVASLARTYGISRATVAKVRDRAKNNSSLG